MAATQYVNMHEAYDDLSPATKARIDDLKAVHVYLSKYSPRELRPLSTDLPRPQCVPKTAARYVRIESILGMEDEEEHAHSLSG